MITLWLPLKAVDPMTQSTNHSGDTSITIFFADTPCLRVSMPSCTLSNPPFRTKGSGFA